MKRSNSKKEGLSRPEDENQQKISSFFQKGPVPAQSKLFTNVKRTKPPLTLQRKTSTSKMGSSSAPSASKPAALGAKKSTTSSKTSMTVLKDFNSTSKAEHKTPQKSGARADPALGDSPDVMIIPDTPEEKLEKPRPKAASRSFLCPVSMLSTMPGKRPSPPKTKLKRTTKKPMGPVSIEFGAKRLSGDQGREDAPGGGFKLNAVKNDSGENIASEVKGLTSGKACSESTTTTLIKFGEDVDYSDFAFESGCSSPVSCPNPVLEQTVQEAATETSTQAVTPTKSYSDGHTVKRMAKPGSSPAPKKMFQQDSTVVADGEGLSEISTSPQRLLTEMCRAHSNNLQDSSPPHLTTSYPARELTEPHSSLLASSSLVEPSTSQRKVKAKRQLATMSGFKDVKEMNLSVNNYQMGGSAKAMTTDNVSCAEDDVLADILGQIDSSCAKSVHKPSISHLRIKENKTMAVKNSCESKQEDRMEVETVCAMQDDDVLGEILSELNSSWAEKQTSKSHKHTTPTTYSNRKSKGEDGMDTFLHKKCVEDVAMKDPSCVKSDIPHTDLDKVSASVNADRDSTAADNPHSVDNVSVKQKGKQVTPPSTRQQTNPENTQLSLT